MITHEPPPGAVAPLPLWPTVAAAHRVVWRNLPTLAKVTALPLVLMLLIHALSIHLGPIGYRLVWEFGIELPWVLMAVAWLRFLLLGQQSGDAVVFPRLRKRHGRMLAYALVLSAIHLPLTFFYVLSGALGLEGTKATVAYWALFLTLFCLGLRLGFVYIAAAVDEPYSFAHAWRHTRGISFTLFVAIGLTVVLPWQGAAWLLGHAMNTESDGAALALLLWHAGGWLVEALYLAFFAIAFRTCTGWVPAPDPGMLERFE